ncbi:pilus assembly FimT family protein [Levilactobacillus humaensis]|uniref:pilus assembly FimT family protein n=1 Tax=Levilactobacillus humaensis TaxID=2950375 RepID=UPI0021C4901F|nr:type II secretion system protein [Levilactobacillus humaensis]
MRRRRDRRQGFTLYETLLVLAIVAGLTTLVGFQASHQRQITSERAFWPVWQQAWTAGRQWALAHRTIVDVHIDPNTGRTSFRDGVTHHLLRTVKAPPGLRLLPPAADLEIRRNGVSTAQTLWWHSRPSGNYWQQTFQIGGALIYVEATTEAP